MDFVLKLKKSYEQNRQIKNVCSKYETTKTKNNENRNCGASIANSRSVDATQNLKKTKDKRIFAYFQSEY